MRMLEKGPVADRKKTSCARKKKKGEKVSLDKNADHGSCCAKEAGPIGKARNVWRGGAWRPPGRVAPSKGFSYPYSGRGGGGGDGGQRR